MCISSYIRIYMFTCTKKHVFPIRFIQEKRHPGPLFYSPAQVGTAPAAHGALQAMDPKRSWQCTWRCGKKKRLSWFVYKKKIGGNKFDFFLQRLLFASKKIFIVCTFYCLFAMCSEPLAVSSDIYGTCLVVFLEADASKQHLWHLGWFCQDDRCDFTLTMFFVPKTFFCLNTHLKFAITPEHIPIPKKRTGSSSWPTIFQG